MAKRRAPLLKGGEYTALGFRAAQVERESGRPQPSGGSADFHARYDRDLLVRQSQQFDRDNGIYQGVLNRGIDNILGSGFSLQARTLSPRANAAIESAWKEYTWRPEVRGLMSWWQTERTTLRRLMVDGDVGAILTDRGLIQPVVSERIRSGKSEVGGNRIEQGVELDPLGAPLAFHVGNYNRAGFIGGQSRRYPAESFIFIANLTCFTQTRGLPALLTNFPMFHRVNDICDSEAVAWQLLSRLALTVLKKDGAKVAHQLSDDPATASSASAKDLATRIQDFDYGMIFHGEPGEEIKGIDRNIPGPNFTASITMFLRLLGLPLGLPLELILLDWSRTNYSSARAALEQAFRMFTCWQRLLIERWHRPIYLWKLRQWIAEGRVPNRADITEHEWITPSFPWIDQLKEAQAWGERIDRGLTTLGEACKALNRDRGEWLVARKREVEEAIEVADELNAKYPGANVSWHMFAGMGDKPGQIMTQTQNDSNQASPDDERKSDDMPDMSPSPKPENYK